MRFSKWFHQSKDQLSDPRGSYPDPTLKDLILFVTERCNMRCDHCLFWRRIDRPGQELTLEQLHSVADSIPPLRTLAITGGEPFLRPDLPEIVETFYQRNHTQHIQVNTNGLLMERMTDLVELDLALRFEKHLTYQVSVDGLEDTHDRLRQTPGSFKRIMENLKLLVAYSKTHPFFRVVVLTNVNGRNYGEIDALGHYLWEEIGVPHVYDLVRGVSFSSWGIPKEIRVDEDPRNCDFPPLDKLESILDIIKNINTREGGQFDQCVRQLEIQIEQYLGKPAPFRCLTAGRTVGVVYSDGSIAACEFTTPFATLSEYDYDLGVLWRSQEADQRRSQITRCACSHTCFVLTSLQEWEEQRERANMTAQTVPG